MLQLDSQRYSYFTNLLHEGTNIDEQFMTKFPNQVGQHLNQPTHVSATKKTQSGDNFIVEEDLLIVSAFLNMNMNAVQENEQKHKTYWKRVQEYFHKYKTFKFDRTP